MVDGKVRPARMDALLLDLGNVLVFHDNERLYGELAAAFQTSIEAVKGILEGGLWERINRGLLPGDSLRRWLVARLGAEVPESSWLSLWNCHFSIHHPMVEIVEHLVDRMPLVLLSNTHDQHLAHLRSRLPVLGRFRGLALSCETGWVKPEAAIYQRALELAAVSPERAAFFDDIPRYADAASALGIQGRVFTTADAFLEDARALGLPL